MFDWLVDLIGGIGEALGSLVESMGSALSGAIFDGIMQWFYQKIYSATADFFAKIGNMGAEIFELSWVQATVKLFSLFGWALFAAGLVVAVFDIAIEYQSGRANIKSTVLHVLKGFFACHLIGTLPIELYKFCITLQNSFSDDVVLLFTGSGKESLSETGTGVLIGSFFAGNVSSQLSLIDLLCLVAFTYCVVKLFFANIKRGGILLTQIAVGSLYMFSVPRGYSDGFTQWCKQIIALCLTAFLQTTLLYLGLLTFSTNMILGLGIMLAASEVPRIAQQFGLDTSINVNMMSVVQTTAMTAANFSRGAAKAAPKGAA